MKNLYKIKIPFIQSALEFLKSQYSKLNFKMIALTISLINNSMKMNSFSQQFSLNLIQHFNNFNIRIYIINSNNNSNNNCNKIIKHNNKEALKSLQ